MAQYSTPGHPAQGAIGNPAIMYLATYSNPDGTVVFEVFNVADLDDAQQLFEICQPEGFYPTGLVIVPSTSKMEH
jgi:hypothetical protein